MGSVEETKLSAAHQAAARLRGAAVAQALACATSGKVLVDFYSIDKQLACAAGNEASSPAKSNAHTPFP